MTFPLSPRELRDAEIDAAGAYVAEEEAPSVNARKHDTLGA